MQAHTSCEKEPCMCRLGELKRLRSGRANDEADCASCGPVHLHGVDEHAREAERDALRKLIAVHRHLRSEITAARSEATCVALPRARSCAKSHAPQLARAAHAAQYMHSERKGLDTTLATRFHLVLDTQDMLNRSSMPPGLALPDCASLILG
eukprot:5796622-Pleurochrysis_carterae.AAC.1